MRLDLSGCRPYGAVHITGTHVEQKEVRGMDVIFFEIVRAYRRARRARLYIANPALAPERAARFECPTSLSTMLI